MQIEANNIMEKTRDLFKKIRDTKRTFHVMMGIIKGRNGTDLNPGGFVKAGSLKNKAKMSDEGCCCFGNSVHRLCEGHP